MSGDGVVRRQFVFIRDDGTPVTFTGVAAVKRVNEDGTEYEIAVTPDSPLDVWWQVFSSEKPDDGGRTA